MTKAAAFLKQARADLAFFDALEGSADARVLECHRLQVLQMAVEKLCKAFLYNNDPELDYGHAVVRVTINLLTTGPAGEILGYRSFKRYRAFLGWAIPVLSGIESVTPAVSVHNAEYPRHRDPTDPAGWAAPCDDPPKIVGHLLRGGNGPAAILFVRRLADRAETIFATA